MQKWPKRISLQRFLQLLAEKKPKATACKNVFQMLNLFKSTAISGTGVAEEKIILCSHTEIQKFFAWPILSFSIKKNNCTEIQGDSVDILSLL